VSTPGRLAVMIHNAAESQNTITKAARGPAMEMAKGDPGEWPKAAKEFTKGQGRSPEDMYTRGVTGVEYRFVEHTIDGNQRKESLREFREIINSLDFQQRMRWGEVSYKFGRPIGWLVGLADEEVIPFEIAEVKTDRETRGHRFLGSYIRLSNANEYEAKLKEN